MTFTRTLLAITLLANGAPAQDDPAKRVKDWLGGLLSPAQKTPAAAPAGPPRDATIAEARGEKTKALLRVRGALIYESGPGSFCIADKTHTIRGQIDNPIAMKPGDLLEITARTSFVAGRIPWFWHASAVNLGKGEYPSPIPFSAGDAYLDEEHRWKFDATFVTMRGRVTGYGTHSQTYTVRGAAKKFTFDTVEVDDDGVRVIVFPQEKVDAAEVFPVGTVAEFTGTCRLESRLPEGGAGFVHVLVPTTAHIRVVKMPPLWEIPRYRRRMQAALLALAAIAALGIAWLLGKWRALRRANATLETRVAGRTVEIERALAAERELSTLRANFVSLVSHEFRTPLEIILTSSDILERYHERLPAEKRLGYLHTIHETVKRMGGMMEDVLLLGRVEAGRLEFKPAPLDLAKLCHRIVDETHSAVNGGGKIALRLNGAATGATGDESLVLHLLANLLSNAVKYSPDGSPVEFTVTRAGDDAIFTIADQGRGIPAADRARLFESFQRGSNVGDTPGTGLGLLIAKKAAEVHGGSITFESAEGAGTTFTVTLPLYQTQS